MAKQNLGRMTQPEVGDLIRFKTAGVVRHVRQVHGTHFWINGHRSNYEVKYDGLRIENLTKGDNPRIELTSPAGTLMDNSGSLHAAKTRGRFYVKCIGCGIKILDTDNYCYKCGKKQ